jgi:invasion protein IalB
MSQELQRRVTAMERVRHMASFKPEFNRTVSMAVSRSLIMAAAAGALFLTSPVAAQQPAKQSASQKAADAKKIENSSAWVKLCAKQKGDKPGDVCLTHHERFHPTTGQPLISAAIRKIEGKDQEMVMVMVPLGRLLKSGLILTVDEEKPLKMNYSFCTSVGCVAETPVTPEILASFKKGKQLSIGTIDINQKRIGFRVSLDGFTNTYDGPPIDRKIYAQARKEMFQQIRMRQMEMAKRAKAAAEKKKAAGGAAAPAPKKSP